MGSIGEGLESLDQNIKRVVISGYYGFNNSGDEAVLQSILQALERAGAEQGVQISPIVLSQDPAGTSERYGVETVPRMKLSALWHALRRCDGLISGGGSLLQDATGVKSIPYYLGVIQMAHLLRKPVFIYAQGIGPIHRPIFKPWIRRVYQRAAYLSVRDRESAALLTSFGIEPDRIELVPDPVMGLEQKQSKESVQPAAAEKPVIGVSVRFWTSDRRELEALGEALRQIADQIDVRIRMFSFHPPQDTAASKFVEAYLLARGIRDIKQMSGLDHPLDMAQAVGRCQLFIGMRLHSLIYAASQHVPVLGISYDPKIDHFLARLDQKPAASTEHFDIKRVVGEALTGLADAELWRQKQQKAVSDLRNESQRPAQHIAASLRK